MLGRAENLKRGRRSEYDSSRPWKMDSLPVSAMDESLTYMHRSCILRHMRTTLNIDDDIFKKASKLTGIKEKTSLVRLGLEALIARESSRRLAELGGSEKSLKAVPRRRTSRN